MIHSQKIPLNYKLGLDLGESSVGWWLRSIEDDRIAPRYQDAGVIIFDSAYEQGKKGRGDTKCAGRRSFRGARRVLRRRADRRKKVKYLLRANGLWPQSKEETAELNKLCPYYLRTEALTRKLPPFELGRAIQHLGQRRGFQSNRKKALDKIQENKKDKNNDKNKPTQNTEFPDQFKASGCETIGQYLFQQLDNGVAARDNRILREHVQAELELIFQRQSQFNPANSQQYAHLLPELKSAILDQLDYDRFVKNQIGRCSLEPNRSRMPRWHRKYKEYELLQRLHNLRYRSEHDALWGGPWHQLTPDQVSRLFGEINLQATMSIGKAIELLGLSSNTVLNTDNKSIPGNATESTLLGVFGERWHQFNDEHRDSICRDIIRLSDADLAKKAREVWNLDDAQINKLINLNTTGYGSLSLTAINRLLPHMRTGLDQYNAMQKVYGDRQFPVYDKLPHPPGHRIGTHDGSPVPEELYYRGEAGETRISNPVVRRTLSTVRELVNTLIDRHGKPAEITVELARDAKLVGKSYTQYMQKLNNNTKARNDAKKKVEELGGRATSDSILRWKLYTQFDTCPYSGTKIEEHELLCENRIEIDHIIPKTRCKGGDNFDNLILCRTSANRDKKNKTPAEWIGSDSDKWKRFLSTIAQLKTTAPRKYEFLTATNVSDELIGDDGFTNRQLQDTSFASKITRQYLQCLYPIDERAKRVETVKGIDTALLRKCWGLNKLLAGGNNMSVTEKNRCDLRHHAIDALVITLATPKRINDLRRYMRSHPKGETFPMPWPGFHAEAERLIGEMIVCHKPKTRLRGRLMEANAKKRKNVKNTSTTTPVLRSGGHSALYSTKNNHHTQILSVNGKLKTVVIPLKDAIKNWKRNKHQGSVGLPRFTNASQAGDFINYLCLSHLVQIDCHSFQHFPNTYRLSEMSKGDFILEPAYQSGQKKRFNMSDFFSQDLPLGRIRCGNSEFSQFTKIEINILGEIISAKRFSES